MIQEKTAKARSLQFTTGDNTALYQFGTSGNFKTELYSQYISEAANIPSRLSFTQKRHAKQLEAYFHWRAFTAGLNMSQNL
jgi:hypothetical protein